MKKVAIAFSTKDRAELSKRSIQPLAAGAASNFDLYWIDGSTDAESASLPAQYDCAFVHSDIRGGADPAIVYSLSTLLDSPADYDFIGLVENDVLLDDDWFAPTMALFEQGKKDGLHVGAVSARCYEDRILFQRDGYAVMHNLGAGMIIFSRAAAEVILAFCRTGHTLENRRMFMQVSGLDIARWNGFVRDAHATCMDWQFERILAQHGFAALALTPSKCQMIGQNPPLEQQGLKLVSQPVEALRHEDMFLLFVDRMNLLFGYKASLLDQPFFSQDDGSRIVMPHQLGWLWGNWTGGWQLKWVQAHGPFVYVATEANALIDFMVSGPISVLASGGAQGGSIRITDDMTGFDFTVRLEPEAGSVLALAVPASIATRKVTVIALQPGVTFYGLNVRGTQMLNIDFHFNHDVLPQP